MARQTAPHPSSARPPSRVNKQGFTTYVSPEALKQLKQLALDTGTTGQELGVEALNLLFKKYKLEQIA